MSWAMFDSGSQGMLISEKFSQNYLSNTPHTRTNTTLKFAGGNSHSSIKKKVDIFFRVIGHGGNILFKETFMIVPELNFDIYLGSPFIQSKDFLCYDGRGIYLSPDGQIDGQPLRSILSRDPQVIRTDVHYMSQKSYSRPTKAVRNATSSLNIGMTMGPLIPLSVT